MSKPRRILLKISGESLKSEHTLVNQDILRRYAKIIEDAFNDGIEVGVVVGGGNILRGSSESSKFSRVTGDQVGMLATVMNALFLRDALSVPCAVRSAVAIDGVVKHFDSIEVKESYATKVIIFAAGIGTPFFSTDTALAVRAIETDCDAIIKLTDIGGVFTADPVKDSSATLISRLTFDQALHEQYSVMDLAAFCLCKEHSMPIYVTNLLSITSIADLLNGEIDGTIITP